MINKVINRILQLMSDYRWWGFYLQRQFSSVSTRDIVSNLIASHLRPKATLGNRLSAKDLTHANELSKTGISLLGELLDSAACTELFEYFKSKSVYDPYRDIDQKFFPLEDNKRNPEAHIAHHDPADILQAPHLMDLANDPRIIGIVEKALGCKPTIGYMAAWWSYATNIGAQQAENFHRDVDDWRFFKLFVYLTDVDESKGPHVYVKNTAASSKLNKIRRYSDEEVRRNFPHSDIIILNAPKGQGFLENTYGIHKGQPVADGVRLIFQVVYTLFPIPYGPMHPIATKSATDLQKHDAWTNRIYIETQT